MSIKIFEEINVKFPKTDEKLEKSYKSCKDRNKYITLDKQKYFEHLEMAKDDLSSIRTDFDNKNWRWVITKSYYSIFHATNALLIYKLGFFSKDHTCAIIALKKENLITQEIYKKLGKIYNRFSDIFGFAVMFEARKISQYDVVKWKELTESDAAVARDFAKEFISFAEGECK